jgi:hypothetical protein
MDNVRKHQKPPSATTAQLRKATAPVMVPVAPHLYALDPNCPRAPEFSIGKYLEVAPGKFKFVPVLEHFARVDNRVLSELGIANQWHTLCRLARAGFIELIAIAPRCYLLNLDSYYNHVRRCAEGGEGFWSEGKGNLEAYREALL